MNDIKSRHFILVVVREKKIKKINRLRIFDYNDERFNSTAIMAQKTLMTFGLFDFLKFIVCRDYLVPFMTVSLRDFFSCGENVF